MRFVPAKRGLAVAGMVTHANGTAERRASEIPEGQKQSRRPPHHGW
jgi:hypothetical protein